MWSLAFVGARLENPVRAQRDYGPGQTAGVRWVDGGLVLKEW